VLHHPPKFIFITASDGEFDLADAPSTQAIKIVAVKLEELRRNATSSTIRVKLGNLDDVCRHIVLNGKQRLTVPSVVSAYASRFPSPDQSIAESSIRNKRGGANPFQQLYRAWENAAEIVVRSRKPSRVAVNEIMGESELSAIPDLVLRHQVALLVTQNRSYKSQLDTLKQVRGAPIVQLVGQSDESQYRPLDNDLALNEAELEAIRDFLTGRKLKALRLDCTTDGGISTKDGRRLADPGFMEALEKILRSYRGS